MATRIDTYVKHLQAQNAVGMMMRTGQPIALRYAEGPPKPTKKAATDDEIKAVVTEIMDDAASTSLQRNGRASFLHVAEGGVRVKVSVERSASGMKCEVTLDTGHTPASMAIPSTPMASGGASRTQGIQMMTPAASANGPARTQGISIPPQQLDEEAQPEVVMTPRAQSAPARTQGQLSTPPVQAQRNPSSAQLRGATTIPPGAQARGGVHQIELENVDEQPPPEEPPQELAMEPVVSSGGGDEPIINNYLRRMVEKKASDLHLRSDAPPYLRISGGIVPITREKLSPESVEGLLMEVVTDAQRALFEKKKDLDFAHAIPGCGRFRMNYFMDRRGPGLVARLIPEKILTLDELGCPSSFKTLCELNRGLVLVTGPTGSGKSTTLAAMIDYINANRDEHILTLEDPIEFVHPQKKCVVTQREIHTHTESFSTALRAALREDPDTILVGEMRDLETISLAIETAETGHLVFGTLHTNTAPSTVDRIIDVFPTDRQGQIRSMLANSLKGVIAQSLLRKQGGGRVAAYEVMLGTFSVANLIREGKVFQLDSIIQTGRQSGMMTLNDSIHALVKKKLVSPEEAYAVSLKKDEMKKLLAEFGWQPPSEM